jgi:hypothetical protein
MNVSNDQADALGGCTACQSAGTTPATSAPPGPSPVVTADPDKRDWIGVELKTPDGKPLPNERFELKLGDGTIIGGRLDNLGKVRIEGIDPGNCTITFPDRDAREWKKT